MGALIDDGNVLRNANLARLGFCRSEDGACAFERQTNVIACQHASIIGKPEGKRKVPQNIAIVDEGAHLLVFARMDGAKLSSVEVALTKARAAALRRAPTGPSPAGEPSVMLSLGLSLATDGKLTCIRGGLPLMVEGQCVGGIGVSAGTEAEDVLVGEAGVDALARLSQ